MRVQKPEVQSSEAETLKSILLVSVLSLGINFDDNVLICYISAHISVLSTLYIGKDVLVTVVIQSLSKMEILFKVIHFIISCLKIYRRYLNVALVYSM